MPSCKEQLKNNWIMRTWLGQNFCICDAASQQSKWFLSASFSCTSSKCSFFLSTVRLIFRLWNVTELGWSFVLAATNADPIHDEQRRFFFINIHCLLKMESPLKSDDFSAVRVAANLVLKHDSVKQSNSPANSSHHAHVKTYLIQIGWKTHHKIWL